MIVYINGRFFTQKITGVQRYAREVVNQIDKILGEKKEYEKFKFVLIVPRETKVRMKFKNIKVVSRGNLRGHLWEQFELPFYIKNNFLINLCNAAPVFKKNQIVTIHDVSVYMKGNGFSFLFRTWYKFLLKLESYFSRSIVTVSNFSKQEIIKWIPITENKIHVFYEGIEHIKSEEIDDRIIFKNHLERKPYILAVGSIDPRKNFKNLVAAFRKIQSLNINIVIAGGMNKKIFKNDWSVSLKNVKYLGYVTDRELKSLYKRAYFFIYPSLYEGFGLPPLEAMTMGCPVIVSNKASLPEICDSAALYCNPYSVSDIFNKMKYLYEDDNLRKKYSVLGKRRANDFSWYDCALGILRLIK